MVHKGLDIVLEAFIQMPEYQLTIIGPVLEEPQFVDLYRKELFHTRNIHFVGWVDNVDEEFGKILKQKRGACFRVLFRSRSGCSSRDDGWRGDSYCHLRIVH